MPLIQAFLHPPIWNQGKTQKYMSWPMEKGKGKMRGKHYTPGQVALGAAQEWLWAVTMSTKAVA